MLYLPKNVEKLVNVASKEEYKYALNGVRVLELDGGQSYRLEATDGRRLAVVQGHCDGDDSGDIKEYIVAMRDWTAAFKMPNLKDRDFNLRLRCDAIEGQEPRVGATFTTNSGAMNAACLEGRYPKIDAIVPRRSALATVKVNAKLLAEVLLVAANFADGETLTTTLTFFGPGIPLWISTTNSEGQIFDGAVAPLDAA